MALLRNPRHEKFSQLVASGIKPSEAYVALGYSSGGAAQAANNLLERPDVRARIDEILSLAAQSVAEGVALDKKRVLSRLDVLSRKAEDLKQIAAAVRCEELLGKELGMFVDRSKLQISVKDALERADPSEVDAYIAELEARKAEAAAQIN